jgi:hypothetical protein
MFLHLKEKMGLLILLMSLNASLFAAEITTLLTDQDPKNDSITENVSYTQQTPMIYLLWKSSQLKEGQIIKAVWIADDTHNVAPPNFKIDSSELTLGKLKDGQEQWGGTFNISKPTKGWPVGSYHTEIYVNNDLIKAIRFTVIPASDSQNTVKESDQWGAIAVDSTSHDKNMAYGVGGGASKDEAGKNAVGFCRDNKGNQCSVMVVYQQCGAYAISAKSHGIGQGETKALAAQKAINNCKAIDCSIIASDCNNS